MNKLLILRIAVIVIGSIILIFATTKQNQSVKVLESKTNFEMIDTYKGCDVVRYAPPNGANYHYFLDCQK
jgi:hypothetical protein